MNQKLARFILIILGGISIPAAIYPFYKAYTVLCAVQEDAELIEFDTGSFYLILMSSFWLGGVITFSRVISLKLEQKESFRLVVRVMHFICSKASHLFVAWFVLCLIIANVAPRLMARKIEIAGYLACEDKREASRVSRGKSLIYIKGKNCRDIDIGTSKN